MSSVRTFHMSIIKEKQNPAVVKTEARSKASPYLNPCPATAWHTRHHGPCQASRVILHKPPHVSEQPLLYPWERDNQEKASKTNLEGFSNKRV